MKIKLPAKHPKFLMSILLCSFFIAACQSESSQIAKADILFINGLIYTMDKDMPWAESVAIKDKRFVAVGANEDTQGFQGEQTQVIDLEGKMAMPGLVDAHVHPVLAGIEKMFQCNFLPAATPEEIEQTIAACIDLNPDSEWVVGGRWDSDFFKRFNIESPKKWLDTISQGKTIVLQDDTGHNRLGNSKALNAAGINKQTRIPGGEVVLGADGEPNGLLHEAAMMPLLSAIPSQRTPEDYQRAARLILDSATEYGITAFKEAGDSHNGVLVYKALDLSGKLNHHMAFAISVPLNDDGKTLDTERLNQLRENNRTEHINTDFVKIFLDGVPAAPRTAAMLDNYLPSKKGANAHRGKLLLQPEILKDLITQLDAMGITVNIHAAGDRAVRVTLDAIEHARQTNGDSGLRHEAAHAGLIAKEDIPRFKQLNAVADMSPAIWFPAPIMNSIAGAIGRWRSDRYFPINTLLEAGVEVSAGSDLPAVLPNMNPWHGIEAMVTRAHPEGSFPGVLGPDQAITLEQALEIYTLNGARVLKLESETGSITVGKLADMAVLDQNIFDIPPEEISSTNVDLTLFEGRIVHRR